jgi:hypothetical protein
MKKTVSLVFLALLLAFTIFSGSDNKTTPVLDKENREQAYQNVLCSAVRIQCNGHYGSGSILELSEKEAVIVTNRHVIQYFDENSYITFFNGISCEGEVLGCSQTADIGYLLVSLGDMEEEDRKALRMVEKSLSAYESLQKNSSFFMIDIASDRENPEIYSGAVVEKEKYLAEYGTEMLYGDGTAVPGMSGSGLFDDYGHFIGVLSGATEHYELAAVPLTTVLEEYKKTRLT